MHLSFRGRFLLRVVALLFGIVFVIGTLAWFFALPLEAHYFAHRLPVLRQTPVPLRDSSFTQSPGRKITFCGSEFDVPWSDLDDGKTKIGRWNTMSLYFDSGLIILLKCLPPQEFVHSVLSYAKVSHENLRRAFGSGPSDSDYALARLILETTPMSFRTPHRQQGPLMSLLVLKATATPPADSGMFAIHAGEFEGFQYQDPQASPDSVLMDLYAGDRGLELQFFLHYHGASPRVSQSDLNRVLRTLHKTGPYCPPKQGGVAPSHN